MAERSKAPDSRDIPFLHNSEISGPRMRAWVRIPLLTKTFFRFFKKYKLLILCVTIKLIQLFMRVKMDYHFFLNVIFEKQAHTIFFFKSKFSHTASEFS